MVGPGLSVVERLEFGGWDVAELAVRPALIECWWTVMNAVIEHGTPLVDTPDRVGMVAKLGVDETSFQAARPGVATKYVTGLVDLERRAMIDMTPGNRAADLRRWCANADPAWLAKIEVVATDLAESYRAGLSPHLDHCVRVADPFHVVRVANRCMDNTGCRRTSGEAGSLTTHHSIEPSRTQTRPVVQDPQDPPCRF